MHQPGACLHFRLLLAIRATDWLLLIESWQLLLNRARRIRDSKHVCSLLGLLLLWKVATNPRHASIRLSHWVQLLQSPSALWHH